MAEQNQIGYPVVDEDDMSSDSPDFICTQQSIKAYVDAQVGGMSAFEFISSQTASTDSSLEFIDLSADYFAYLFCYSNIVPTAAGGTTYGWARLSTDNGSSFYAGASDYGYGEYASGSASNNVIRLTTNASDGPSQSADRGVSGYVLLLNPMNSSYRTSIVAQLTWPVYNAVTVTTWRTQSWGGMRNAAEADNAIQFAFDPGNISTGQIFQYGIKAS